MKAQELSNSLWAAAQLQYLEPKVWKIVPAIVQQIPVKACDMKAQELANTLEGLVLLGESSNIVQQQGIVEAAAAKLKHTPRAGGPGPVL